MRGVGRIAFLTSAGYASANVQFNFGDPEFVHGGYTVAAFEVRHLIQDVREPLTDE